MEAKKATRSASLNKAAGLVAALLLTAAGSAGAAEPTACASRETGAKAQISFSECRVETTPPYEDGSIFECGSGEVIVAVYANAVRCCSLTLG